MTTQNDQVHMPKEDWKEELANLKKPTTVVNLRAKNITHLPMGAFDKISNCQNLDLSDNNMSVIKDGTFKNLVHLMTLTLSGNPLREIRGGMWEGLQSLQVLDITSTNLTKVQLKGFAHLESIKTLVLNVAALKKFESGYINTSTYPHSPRNQVKFRIELGGREITCDNSFCFLNNMQKQGLIRGFTAKGEEIQEPVCSKDQNPFWKYSSVNCDSIGE